MEIADAVDPYPGNAWVTPAQHREQASKMAKWVWYKDLPKFQELSFSSEAELDAGIAKWRDEVGDRIRAGRVNAEVMQATYALQAWRLWRLKKKYFWHTRWKTVLVSPHYERLNWPSSKVWYTAVKKEIEN